MATATRKRIRETKDASGHEHDERGRFGSGGGSPSDHSKIASQHSQDAIKADTKSAHDKAVQSHAFAARSHQAASKAAFDAGDKEKARAHDAEAERHHQAAMWHQDMGRTATKESRNLLMKRSGGIVLLHERAPLGDPGRPGRVDRSTGVIYGVKVVGRVSPNTHGVNGVDGTEYTLEALRTALPLYEGIKVNVDHPPRQRPGMERSARDRFAWLENVTVQESGIFGDLHFLDPTDPLAVKMLNAAELKPDSFALSHNAVGKGEVKNRRYIVREIPEVQSVDIVADGGTNRSLFEGRTMKDVKVCEVMRDKVLPALGARQKTDLERLLKTCLSETRSPLMEADEDGEKDHRDHMYTAMRAAEDAGNEEAATGIHKLLHPAKRVEEEEPEKEKEKQEDEEGGEKDERSEMEGEGEEGPGEPGEHNEGPDGKGGPAFAKESRKGKKLAQGEVRLNESRALAMCKTAGVECTADVLEAIRGADFDQAMRVINLAKRAQNARTSSAPRSIGQHRTAQALPAETDVNGWCSRLLN